MEKFGELDEAKLVSGAGQMLKHVDACYLPKQSYMGSQICCHVLHQVSHMISHNYKYAAISSHQLPHTFLAFASLHQHGSSSGFAASSTLSRHAISVERFTLIHRCFLGSTTTAFTQGHAFVLVQEGILVYFADDVQSCEQAVSGQSFA